MGLTLITVLLMDCYTILSNLKSVYNYIEVLFHQITSNEGLSTRKNCENIDIFRSK